MGTGDTLHSAGTPVSRDEERLLRVPRAEFSSINGSYQKGKHEDKQRPGVRRGSCSVNFMGSLSWDALIQKPVSRERWPVCQALHGML